MEGADTLLTRSEGKVEAWNHREASTQTENTNTKPEKNKALSGSSSGWILAFSSCLWGLLTQQQFFSHDFIQLQTSLVRNRSQRQRAKVASWTLKMGTWSSWAERPEGWGLLIKRFWREFSSWMGFPRGGEESKKREARFEPSGSLGGLGKAPQRKCPSWVKLGQIVKVATSNFCSTDFQLSGHTELDSHRFRQCLILMALRHEL